MNHTASDKKINVTELLDTFQKIESGIQELHQNSSQVFLQLNDFLKEYNKKNSIVAKNATQIFDTLTGDNDSCLICDLKDIFNEFEAYKKGTENEFNNNLELYNVLLNKIDDLTLLLRNLKQDLITLKFLLTNYRIISGNEASNNLSNKSIDEWEKILVNINSGITEMTKETAELKKKLGKLLIISQDYSQDSRTKYYSYSEDLKASLALINKKNLESRNYIPVLKEKINSSSQSIGNIITHLQYHDIIRQKVEHIQKSHFNIIESLKDNHSDNHKVGRNNNEILPLIADISELQAAQLILISKEYQKALEVISENFQKIANDLAAVSTISHEFSYETANSDNTLINNLKDNLDRSLVVLDSYNSNLYNEQLLEIKQKISEIYNFIAVNITTPLGEMGVTGYLKALSSENKRESNTGNPSIVSQISSLTTDILRKKDDLSRESELLFHNSEKFSVADVRDGFRSKLEKDQIRIMVNVSKTLERLDNESKKVDVVLDENFTIKKEIINRLKDTLAQADYYELFEKVLNSIIAHLNDINSCLGEQTQTGDRSAKEKNLKEIETFYTVASERYIHNKVISDDTQISISEIQANEDDLELF